MIIEGLVDEYISTKSVDLSSKTIKWYVYHLNTFIKWCKENGFDEPREVVDPKVLLRVHQEVHFINQTSRHGYMQVVRGFLNWCSEDPDLKIREITLRRLRIQKGPESEVEILTPDQIKKLLQAAKHSPNPIRDELMIKLFLDTGIRLKELAFDSTTEEKSGLLVDNVHLKRRGWKAESSFIVVYGKGRKERSINIGDETDAILRKYMRTERGRPDTAYLFVSRLGPLSIRMVEHRVKELGEAAGIPGLHPHLFRHTFAVNALLSGVPELLLMRILGHTSLAATKIYVRAASSLQARNAVPSLIDRVR